MAPPCCCVCGKPSTKQCSTCRSADYCSPRCESNDLDSHRLLCRAFLNFTSAYPKPATNCVLALYFPILPFQTRGRAPVFIWFDGTNKVNKDRASGTITRVNCLADEKNNNPSAEGFEIFANYVKKFQFGHTIILQMRSAFRFDGSRVNLSLIETTKGKLSEPWGGPLVVSCRNGLIYGEGPGNMLKENMFFELEVTNADLIWSVLRQNSGGIAAKGVEISCKGDMVVLGFRKQDIWILKSMDQIHAGACPTQAILAKNGTGKVFGRVLVVREDMKDITPKQVEAIVNFFSQDVSPKINEEIGLARLSGEEAGTELGKFMAELISRAKIDSFFENFKAQKIEGGDTSWVDKAVPEATDGDPDEDSVTRVSQQLGKLSSTWVSEARRDGIDVLAGLLEVEAKIDKTYPTETEAQRVIRLMQNVFEWADEVFNRVIEARNLVTKAKDLSGCRGPVDFDSPEGRLQMKQEITPFTMRSLWNQFDHHTALHNAKPDRYPAVPVGLS
ncbi:hypothetical protein IFR04_014865 [Cadophora malorum]|uniref:MYND-type domain-containing protein n=1 Tax=Cadophora malorum TaxID=108018 RepID=A0A8H7T430_9HELO|nr:hypothetical protein IFR04_014865 [Cadophora malorum]